MNTINASKRFIRNYMAIRYEYMILESNPRLRNTREKLVFTELKKVLKTLDKLNLSNLRKGLNLSNSMLYDTLDNLCKARVIKRTKAFATSNKKIVSPCDLKVNIDILRNRYNVTKELVRWCNKKYNECVQRCSNPNNKDYRYYGARGIRVDFENSFDFSNHILSVLQKLGYLKYPQLTTLQDIQTLKLHIDRIDGNGNYDSENISFSNHIVNPYITKEKCRCAKFANKWYPLSVINKVIFNNQYDSGFNTINKRLGNTLSRAKSKGFYNVKVSPLNILYKIPNNTKLSDSEILVKCGYFVWFDFNQEPLFFNKENKSRCPQCSGVIVFSYHTPLKCVYCDFLVDFKGKINNKFLQQYKQLPKRSILRSDFDNIANDFNIHKSLFNRILK